MPPPAPPAPVTAPAAPAAPAPNAQVAAGDDITRFGYRQELRRTLGSLSAFAAGFSFVSILTTVFQLFGLGFTFGGTSVFWTWPVVFAGQLMVALTFAELAARYPLAGSVYQWAKQVSGGVGGWLAGWMMLIGCVVSTAAAAIALQVVLPSIWSGFQVIGEETAVTSADGAANAVLLGVALIVVTTAINLAGVRLVALVNDAGVVAEVAGVVALVVGLGLFAVRGPQVVFSGQSGPDLPAGSGFAGMLAAALMAAYVLYGFDTAASVSEETRDAQRVAPRAMLRALAVSGVGGLLLLLTALMAAPSLTDGELGLRGLPYVIDSAFGGAVGRLFLCVVVMSIFVCTLTIQAAAIRLMFGMARDGALPCSRALARVSPRSATPPLPALVVGVLAVGLLVLNVRRPALFTVVTGTAVVVVYLAYLLVTAPTLLRRLRGTLPVPPPGTFDLGRRALVVNVLAVVYGAAMAVNIAWPRAAVYDLEGSGTWGARLFAVEFVVIAALVGLGLYAFRRRRVAVRSTGPLVDVDGAA